MFSTEGTNVNGGYIEIWMSVISTTQTCQWNQFRIYAVQ